NCIEVSNRPLVVIIAMGICDIRVVLCPATADRSMPELVQECPFCGAFLFYYQRGCNGIVNGTICGQNRACSINYEKVLAIYIVLQQTLICCHLPRLWPAQPVQLVVDS